MSWEREALGTEAESRSCGALGNSSGSVLIGGSPRQRNRNSAGGVSWLFWVYFFFSACLFVCGDLFCFLRKMIVSFPSQSSEWLVRGRRAQPLGGLALAGENP